MSPMNNPMRRPPVKPGTGNPLAALMASGYAKPSPGSATPEARYKTPERRPPSRPQNRGRGFLDAYLQGIGRGVESLGTNIGAAMGAAASAAPTVAGVRRTAGRINEMLMRQAPAEKRGKFLQRVYADNDMAAGDIPMIRAALGKGSPFRTAGGTAYTPEGYDYALDKFKKSHAWARKSKNSTDAEMAVKYLLTKKHKGYYSP